MPKRRTEKSYPRSLNQVRGFGLGVGVKTRSLLANLPAKDLPQTRELMPLISPRPTPKRHLDQTLLGGRFGPRKIKKPPTRKTACTSKSESLRSRTHHPKITQKRPSSTWRHQRNRQSQPLGLQRLSR